MSSSPLKALVIDMVLLDDCDLLFMVLVMRHRSGNRVCRSTLNLVGSLVADLILVSSIMLRGTSSV
jgi:membrane-associated PAP2 superfamily phosphatase